MNFKSSAIALAVAGTIATPMAAQADLYASARVGIENVDVGDRSDLNVSSFASRFGVRSETDLGNGMTGFGRYEWDVDMQNCSTTSSGYAGRFVTGNPDPDGDNCGAGGGSGVSARHRYVGIKTDAGSLTLGQTYHTYYNLVYGPTDSPWWGSGYFYPSPGRTDNGVTWAGGAGMVNYGITAHFFGDDEEESPDVTEVAVSFGIGDMTLGIGTRQFADYFDDPSTSKDESDGIIGVVLHGIAIGDTSLGIGFQTDDEDDALVIDWTIGNILVHIEQAMLDEADQDPLGITLSYTQSLGRKTTAWYEIVANDADTGNSDDDLTAVRAVLKYDIE